MNNVRSAFVVVLIVIIVSVMSLGYESIVNEKNRVSEQTKLAAERVSASEEVVKDVDYPPLKWNSHVSYYPGNKYVHIIGLTGYNTGTYYKDLTGERWRSFTEIEKAPKAVSNYEPRNPKSHDP